MAMKWFGLVLLQLLAKTVCSSDSNPDGEPLNIYNSFYTPNANMADLSAGPGLVARKRG